MGCEIDKKNPLYVVQAKRGNFRSILNMNLEKGGGWNTVYQQEKGISTVRRLLYLRPDW